MPPTHEVTNQPPPLQDYDVFSADEALRTATEREGAAWAHDALQALGTRAGTPEAIELGFAANRNEPELRTHDRYGHRVDRVDYHPAYHRLMTVAVEAGLHGAPWADARPGAHVARAAGFITWSQVEAGHGCPISMTYSVVPALRAQPDLAAEWVPRLVARSYDGADRPAPGKGGAIAGMGMTEKQGGSDVRANATRAEPSADGSWRLTGHKWFCSAPMSDIFLVLAQAPGGLSCFLLPRWLPDGTRNAEFRIVRLKDKLGNRSNASSEIELDGAAAWLVGEEGRGVRTIIGMVTHTRLDCVLGATATMRQATAQALHHAAHRRAFGRALVDQPLMRNVLADLVVESEAATTVALRLAGATDRAARGDLAEASFRRMGLAVSKYWVCKRGPAHAGEAMECLGGNGYVEEAPLARLYREVPVNSIWEGSGNVMALDVARVLQREPAAVQVVMDELAGAAGDDQILRRAHQRLETMLQEPKLLDARGRTLVEGFAVLAAATILRAHAPPAVADAFIATRIAGDPRQTYGQGLEHADVRAILARASPHRA